MNSPRSKSLKLNLSGKSLQNNEAMSQLVLIDASDEYDDRHNKFSIANEPSYAATAINET